MNQQPDRQTNERTDAKDPVMSISGQIRHMGNGERSTLRNMDLTRSAAAEGLVIGTMMRAGLPVSTMQDAEMEAWSTLVHAAALLTTPTRGGHSPEWPFGRALKRAGFSETRLVQTLATPNPRRIIRAVRFVASAGGGGFDLRTIRAMLDPDQNIRTNAIRTVVREYHTAQQRKQDDNE